MAYEAPYKVSQGVILYSHIPLRRMVTILDTVQGKVDCMVRARHMPPLAHGTLAEYVLQEKNDLKIASFLEPLAVPAEWVREDIYFLHHVLELCTMYIPACHTAQEIISLLSLLYAPWKSDVEGRGGAPFFKKLFLCKLHTLLGMYPDEEVYDPALLSLISCAGDSMFDLQYDTEIESRLTMWLYRSLHASNAHNFLKTFSFIKRLDIYYEDT
jgi:hypothetical protein